MKVVALLFIARSASLTMQSATLRGVISDETGAQIPSANVTVTGPNGTSSKPLVTMVPTRGLRAGDYTVQASTPVLEGVRYLRFLVETNRQWKSPRVSRDNRESL